MLWQHRCFLCLCVQSCPTLCNAMDCSPPGSSVRWISQRGSWSGLPFPSLEDLPDPGIEPVSSSLAGRPFTTEPPGQPLLQCILLVKSCLVIFLPHIFVSFFFPLHLCHYFCFATRINCTIFSRFHIYSNIQNFSFSD